MQRSSRTVMTRCVSPDVAKRKEQLAQTKTLRLLPSRGCPPTSCARTMSTCPRRRTGPSVSLSPALSRALVTAMHSHGHCHHMHGAPPRTLMRQLSTLSHDCTRTAYTCVLQLIHCAYMGQFHLLADRLWCWGIRDSRRTRRATRMRRLQPRDLLRPKEYRRGPRQIHRGTQSTQLAATSDPNPARAPNAPPHPHRLLRCSAWPACYKPSWPSSPLFSWVSCLARSTKKPRGSGPPSTRTPRCHFAYSLPPFCTSCEPCSPPLPLHTILLPIPLPTHHTLAHPPPATSPGLYHLSLLGVDISPGYLRHPAELIFI